MTDNANKNVDQHWCAELFPPTFTCDDVIDESVKNLKFTLPDDFYTNIYSQVVLEEELKNKKKPHQTRKKDIISEDEEKEESFSTFKVPQPKPNDMIWTSKDLHLFRESYVKLKDKAIKLLCIVESKNLKLNDLKKSNKEMKKELKVKDKLLSDTTKENTILKGYVKTHQKFTHDLEEKLQFYEDCNNDLKEIIHDKDSEIKKLRSELISEQKRTEEFSKRIDDIKKRHLVELTSAEESIKTDFELLVANLKKEIKEFTISFEDLKEDCDKYKRSFLELQAHFLDGGIGCFLPCSIMNESEEEKKEFLGITNIV